MLPMLLQIPFILPETALQDAEGVYKVVTEAECVTSMRFDHMISFNSFRHIKL